MKLPKRSVQFKKSYQKGVGQGRDLDEFQKVVQMLVNEEPLPARYRNHYLHNKGLWDVHIEPDWILLYELSPLSAEDPRTEESGNVYSGAIRLYDIGSHSDLFK